MKIHILEMKISIESMNKDFGNNIDVALDYDNQSKVNKPLKGSLQNWLSRLDLKRLWILQLNTSKEK